MTDLKNRDLELKEKIRETFTKNRGRYGVRRITMTLRNAGTLVNHKKVQRLMHAMGLLGKRPKEKYHSYKGETGKIADNIIARDFHADEPLKKWSTDVSQFSLPWGKCYLSPILDMATNEIIAYDLSRNPTFQQVTDMLDRAFEKFPETDGLILHSDMGWQYQHMSYVQKLKEHGIIQSMSRKGNCYDNCIIETFFGRMKTEMFYGQQKEYSSFEVFEKAVQEYIDYYNNERIQKKTKWTPPAVYRKVSMET
jgi:transposase InsO family protein